MPRRCQPRCPLAPAALQPARPATNPRPPTHAAPASPLQVVLDSVAQVVLNHNCSLQRMESQAAAFGNVKAPGTSVFFPFSSGLGPAFPPNMTLLLELMPRTQLPITEIVSGLPGGQRVRPVVAGAESALAAGAEALLRAAAGGAAGWHGCWPQIYRC